MAAQAPSSDLLASSECSSEMAVGVEASNSIDCKHSHEQVEAGVTSNIGTTDRLMVLTQQLVGGIESRVLDAFKQATADIIGHLAKEAASRVIMAERKAAHLEQELIHLKQQALAMLLHQKESTDFQIAEMKCKCIYERKRAEDAENKLSSLQGTVKRLQGELKKSGDILESFQKIRGQRVNRSSSLDSGEGLGTKELKSEQPRLDLDSLLLFAGVACDDASKLSSSSAQKFPFGNSKTQSRLPALSSLASAHEVIESTTAKTILRAPEQNADQCNNTKVAELQSSSVLTNEYSQQTNLSSVPFTSQQNSTPFPKMETPKGVEDMPLASKLGMVKNKSNFQRCLPVNEVDSPRINALGMQTSNAHSAIDSGRIDFEDVSTFEVREPEEQAKQSRCFVNASPFSLDHKHSYSNSNGMALTGDDQQDGLPTRGAQKLEPASRPLKTEYGYSGSGSQKDAVQNGGTKIEKPFLRIQDSFQAKKPVGHDSKERESDCAGENGDGCERNLPKSSGEPSPLQVADTSSGGNTLSPDVSENVDVQQALQCLSEGLEKPESNSVPLKTIEDRLAVGLVLPSSPNMDAGSNVIEQSVLVDNRSAAHVDSESCERNGRPDSTEVLLADTDQVQANSHIKAARKRKVGPKASLANPDISLEEKSLKKPRGPKSSTQTGNNHGARADPVQGLSELKKPANLAVESSRDSRRLMQGARQLFLLAERKWH